MVFPCHLFVYGTLRPSLAVGEPAQLIAGLGSAGPASIQGMLVDLGDYPGLVAGPGTVQGDLLVIETAAQLEPLDAYEECDPPAALFRREQTTAQRPDGSSLTVWAYRYCHPVTHHRVIDGGDYARHLHRR